VNLLKKDISQNLCEINELKSKLNDKESQLSAALVKMQSNEKAFESKLAELNKQIEELSNNKSQQILSKETDIFAKKTDQNFLNVSSSSMASTPLFVSSFPFGDINKLPMTPVTTPISSPPNSPPRAPPPPIFNLNNNKNNVLPENSNLTKSIPVSRVPMKFFNWSKISS
jgi:hypothetical protein